MRERLLRGADLGGDRIDHCLVVEISRDGVVVKQEQIADPRQQWCEDFNAIWAKHGYQASFQPISRATNLARA